MKIPAAVKPPGAPKKPPAPPGEGAPVGPKPTPATSRAPSPVSGPAAAQDARHRIDMRLAPATLSALDKMAAEAQVTRTAMMERLIHQAAGSGVQAEEDAGQAEAARTVAQYERTKPSVPKASPARLAGR